MNRRIKTSYTSSTPPVAVGLLHSSKESNCSWTPYYCVGLLTADAKANLLDSASWKKSPVPVLQQEPENDVYGPGGISFTPSPDGKEWYMLYHARQIPNDAPGASDSRSPRLQKIDWDQNGMPVLGTPQKKEEPMAKPSGSPMNQKQV